MKKLVIFLIILIIALFILAYKSSSQEEIIIDPIIEEPKVCDDCKILNVFKEINEINIKDVIYPRSCINQVSSNLCHDMMLMSVDDIQQDSVKCSDDKENFEFKLVFEDFVKCENT